MQLVATGALTNVALLIILYPEVCSMIDITIMGGCVGIGGSFASVELAAVQSILPIARIFTRTSDDGRILLLQATLVLFRNSTFRCCQTV